jgi:di/tricarboxylate transporter
MLPAPALLAVGLVLGLIILLPARRLQLAGFRSRSIAIYAACLWALAFFLAMRPLAARFLVPILLIAYLAPFIAAPERLSRIVARRRGGGGPGGTGGTGEPPKPPIKNVTPPDEGFGPE